MQTVACDLCGSSDYRIEMKKRGRLVSTNFSIVKCRQCSLVFVNPRISNRLIPDLYDDRYYAGNGFDTSINYFADDTGNNGASNLFVEILESLRESHGSLAGATCLDVGCGTGTLVRLLNAEGATALGLDSSEVARRICQERGIPFLDADVDSLISSKRKFDIVSAVEVIEHVTSPKSFLLSLKALVKPGGILYITTGNWQLVKLQPGTPYIMPEGHLYYFTPTILRAYFREVGIHPNSAFNQTWILWRILNGRKRPVIVQNALRAIARTVSRVMPNFGPFPIGTV